MITKNCFFFCNFIHLLYKFSLLSDDFFDNIVATCDGFKFLNSGPGFGGSCFKKDILNLVYLANHFGLPEVANFWENVIHLNNWNQNRLTSIILQSKSLVHK